MRRSKLKKIISAIAIVLLLFLLKLTGWIETESVIICMIITILTLFIDRFFKKESNYYFFLLLVIGILLFVMSFIPSFKQ